MMDCHVINCKNEATKIITDINGHHDLDLPVCNKHAAELKNDNEDIYDI